MIVDIWAFHFECALLRWFLRHPRRQVFNNLSWLVKNLNQIRYWRAAFRLLLECIHSECLRHCRHLHLVWLGGCNLRSQSYDYTCPDIYKECNLLSNCRIVYKVSFNLNWYVIPYFFIFGWLKSNSCKLIIIGEIVFLARTCNAELSLTTVSETIFVTLDTTDIILWDLATNILKNCRTKDSCFHTVNRVIIKLSIQTWMLNDKCE